MKYLTLYFSAPLQSWGVQSKTNNGTRDTLAFPSRSGICGMICCGLGKRNPDQIFLNQLHNEMSIDIFTISLGNILEDFQSIGANYNPDDEFERLMMPHNSLGGNPQNAILTKQYLADAKFLVVLSSENNELLQLLANAFISPIWPLTFGRKNCIPDSKIYIGICNSIDESKQLCIEYCKNHFENNIKYFSHISEHYIENSNMNYINDVPVEFGEHKKYMERKIYSKLL